MPKPSLDSAVRAEPFVWTVFALLLLAAVAFVARFGSNVPIWDDWDLVPFLTGEQPVTASWLWSQHNEHRVPLPRLVHLVLNELFGFDLRIAMFLDVAAIGLLASAMIVTVRRLRGRASLTDAFFPLVLLHPGHAVNFLWSWQLQFFASTVLSGAVLLRIARCRAGLSVASAAIGVGVLSVLLPLCGANGLSLVLPLTVWLVVVPRLGSAPSRRARVALVFLAVSSALIAGMYFLHYERVPHHHSTHDVCEILGSSLQFLSIGLGPGAGSLWPWSGVVTVAMLLACVVLVGLAWRGRPQERERILGMFLFLVSVGSLALGVGLGRDGLEPRYVTLAAPAWCAIYLVVSVYGPGRIGFLLRLLLVLCAASLFFVNARSGIAYASTLKAKLESFERDMAAGHPPYVLIHRHGKSLHPHHHVPTDYLPMLKRAGVGKFALLSENPSFREISVPLEPMASGQVVFENGIARCSGKHSFAVFSLPEDTHAAGVRLTYSHSDSKHCLPYVSMYWKSSAESGFTYERFSKFSPTGDRAVWERGTLLRNLDPETTFGAWTCAPIREIRIHPDFKPCTFQFLRLVLLVPNEE